MAAYLDLSRFSARQRLWRSMPCALAESLIFTQRKYSAAPFGHFEEFGIACGNVVFDFPYVVVDVWGHGCVVGLVWHAQVEGRCLSRFVGHVLQDSA